MAPRRKIKVRTSAAESATEVANRAQKVRATVIRNLGAKLTDEDVTRFTQFILNQNWDKTDVESATAQWSAGSRADVVASLHHNEHALDAVMRNQCAATGFVDSARSPNFAIRHKGNAELLLRRISLGDTILLRAAHNLSAKYNLNEVSSTHMQDYWQQIWQLVLLDLSSDTLRNVSVLYEDSLQSAALALEFAHTVNPSDRTGELVDMFMTAGSPYTFGVFARRERIRRPDSEDYQTGWVFHQLPENRDAIYEFAVNVALWAVDRRYLNIHETGSLPWRADTALGQYIETRGLPDYIDATALDNPYRESAENFVPEHGEVAHDDGYDTNVRVRRVNPTLRDFLPRMEQTDDGNQETPEPPTAGAIDPSRLLP